MAQFVEPEQLTPLQYTGTGEHWLFTENQSIGTHIYLPNEEFMEIDSMGIYADECGSLSLVGMSYPAYGDLGLSFTTTTFGVGEVFYIRIFASNAPASYPFSVIVTNGSSPAWCASLGACELLCNPSFENSSNSIYPDPWIANSYTPDYIQGSPHPNMNLSPRSGNAMMGLITFYQNVGRPEERESISIPLEQPVSAGKWVYGEMYVRWDDHASSLVQSGLTDITYLDYLEMLFTQGAFNMNPTLPTNSPTAQITPLDNQGISTVGWLDNTNWKKISGVFEVQGTQVDHLTISNFKNDAFTAGHVYDPNADFAYALVDDVDVQELPGAGSSNVSVCAGQSVQLGTGACNLPTGASISWTPTTGLNNSSIAQPTATVNQTTLYTMTVTYNGITYSDDVQVEVESLANVITTTDDCNINNPSATITIPNFNSANQYSLSSTNGFTYTTATLSGSQYVFSNINYTNYKDVGTYTIDIVAGPDAGCSLQGKIVRCCCCSVAPLALAQGSYSERSDITNWNNQNFEVGDYFTFDEDVQIKNSTFWMHPDAQIRIDADADVEFINCTFTVSDCNPGYRWDGIVLEGNTGDKFTLKDSYLSHSMRGVFIDGSHRATELINTEFDNNRYAVMLLNHSQPGPYYGAENSWIKAEGNEFKQTCDFGLNQCGITQHPSSPINLLSYYINSTVKFTGFNNNSFSTTGPVMAAASLMHVLIKNVTNFQFGSNNGVLNDFSGDFNLHDLPHIYIENSTGKVSSNRFLSSHVGHIGFHQSDVIVGGFSASERNIFDSKNTNNIRGVHSSESKFYIANNIFKNSSDIAVRNTVAGDVHNISLTGSQVMDNEFRGTSDYDTYFTSPNMFFGSNVYSFFDEDATSTPYMRIYRNTFKNSSNIWLQNHPYQSPNKYSLIHSNGFHGLGFDPTDDKYLQTFINVQNSDNVRIAENNIDCSKPPFNSAPGGLTMGKTASTNPTYNCDNAVGIYLEDCTNCLVDGNGNSPEPTISTNEPVKAGGFGIYLKGDVSGTQLACNELDSNDYHIYLDDVSQWANQGGVVGADNNFLRNTSFLGSADISGGFTSSSTSVTYFHSTGFGPSVIVNPGNLNALPSNPNSCNQISKHKKNDAIAEKPQLQLWPNPVQEALYIEYEGERKIKGLLTDLSGRIIRYIEIAPGVQQLELTNMSDGVYLLSVGRETFQIIKSE